MKTLLVVGAGGYGSMTAETALLSGWDSVIFADDNSPRAAGGFADIEKLEEMCDGSIVATGAAALRGQLFARLKKPVTIINPRAFVSPSARVGRGCVIEAGAVVSSNTIVGDGVYICANAVVNHNAVVGSFCQLDCGSVAAAAALVPDGTKVKACSVFTDR